MKEINDDMKLWKKIFELSNRMHERCEHLHSPKQLREFYDLTVAQLKAMEKVKDLTDIEPDGISLKSLAQGLKISSAATSEVVNDLVNKGMLVREQSQVDRRAICIKFSRKIIDSVKKAHKYWDRKIEELLKDMTEHEVEIFTGTIDKFLKKLNNSNQRGNQ